MARRVDLLENVAYPVLITGETKGSVEKYIVIIPRVALNGTVKRTNGKLIFNTIQEAEDLERKNKISIVPWTLRVLDQRMDNPAIFNLKESENYCNRFNRVI